MKKSRKPREGKGGGGRGVAQIHAAYRGCYAHAGLSFSLFPSILFLE